MSRRTPWASTSVRTEPAAFPASSSRPRALSTGFVQMMDAVGISPSAVARAVAFAVEQPGDVEIGEINIRPTVQA